MSTDEEIDQGMHLAYAAAVGKLATQAIVVGTVHNVIKRIQSAEYNAMVRFTLPVIAHGETLETSKASFATNMDAETTEAFIHLLQLNLIKIKYLNSHNGKL